MFGRIKPYLKGLRPRERHFDSGQPRFIAAIRYHISSWQARFLWSGIRPMGPFSLSRSGPDPFQPKRLFTPKPITALPWHAGGPNQDVREGVSQKPLAISRPQQFLGRLSCSSIQGAQLRAEVLSLQWLKGSTHGPPGMAPGTAPSRAIWLPEQSSRHHRNARHKSCCGYPYRDRDMRNIRGSAAILQP